MKKIFSLLFLVSSAALANSTVSSTIYDIDHGVNGFEDHLLLLDNGSVLKINQKDKHILKTIENSNFIKAEFEFEYDSQRVVKSVSLRERLESFDSNKQTTTDLVANYVPTTVASIELLMKYFKEAPYNPKESQCFNRAMVWSYEWWKNHSLKSMKIFIFFTRNYIRKYNFEWWFHVSPYAHVMVDGKVVERVLDVKYTRGPLSFKNWTDIFMKNDAACPVITKYSDYADYPYTGDCYIYRESMYFYQPADLQMAEAWGYAKEKFNMDEVRGAYKEAFDIDL